METDISPESLRFVAMQPNASGACIVTLQSQVNRKHSFYIVKQHYGQPRTTHEQTNVSYKIRKNWQRGNEK